MGGIAATRATVAALGAVALAGCGGGSRQDASEPSGTYPVKIVRAEFPAAQHIARDVRMRVSVQNAGDKTIPNVALTVLNKKDPGRGGSFGQAIAESGGSSQAADPSRLIWVLNSGPPKGETAYLGTWALGRLAPGKTKEFVFKLTPIRPGRYTLDYRVAAGLNGKAKATAAGGGPAQGTFTVNVSGTPADAVTGTRDGG